MPEGVPATPRAIACLIQRDATTREFYGWVGGMMALAGLQVEHM